MINSKGSVVIGDERAEGELIAPLVVPDHCGEGEHSLEDPRGDPGEGAATMALEIELALQGLIDRLDDLAKGFRSSAPGRGDSPAILGRTKVAPSRAKKASSSRLR